MYDDPQEEHENHRAVHVPESNCSHAHSIDENEINESDESDGSSQIYNFTIGMGEDGVKEQVPLEDAADTRKLTSIKRDIEGSMGKTPQCLYERLSHNNMHGKIHR